MLHFAAMPRGGLGKLFPARISSPRHHEGLPTKTLLGMAAVQLSTGGLFLALAWTADAPPKAQGWAGVLLLATAVVQGKLALKALKQRRTPRGNIFRRTSFWRTSFVGLLLCYLLALGMGPRAAPFVFVAALGVLSTLLLLPIAVSPEILEYWRRISQQRIARSSSLALFLLAAGLVATEVWLRSQAWWIDHIGTPAATAWQMPVASAGFLPSPPASADTDGRLHVALVGDESTLGGTRTSDAFAQLEVLVPGIRVTNFSVPGVGPREYAQQLSDRVIDSRPQLVVMFVSVAEDMLSESAESEWFDWRTLAVARWAFRGAPADSSSPDPAHLDNTTYLRSAGKELAVCRAPTDPDTTRRWQKSLGHLHRLISTCQRQQVEVVLVMTPAEFQLNDQLLQTLCRRTGLKHHQLDLNLPQRRLATFASDRQVPYVDLLPHLRLVDGSPYERTSRRWNGEGTAVAVRTVGSWLQSRYGMQLAAHHSPQLTRK